MVFKKKDINKEELDFDCPVCKKGQLILSKTIHNLPDGDKILIMKFECNKCDFTKNDIIPVDTPIKPSKFILKVNEKEDLESKIFRSFSGVLEIPELEIEIEPGPAADFFITNVEGILQRMKDADLF
jgi:zinc finger protein